MKRLVPSFLAFILLIGSSAAFITPTAHAASSRSSSSSSKDSSTLEFSGWIPYWATAKGTSDADAHLSQLTEINPFGYTVKTDGTLYDAMNVNSSDWQNLFKDARKQGVKIVPTVMWSDTGSIYNVLSNPTLRAQHIASIVNSVTQNNFDGIDIDYEAKSAETNTSFSAFLGELSAALNKADKDLILDCTIEARMPLAARYSGTPPANIEYANDLPKINQYCDRVRLMTYDQQTADLQLNKAHDDELYAPVADSAWVEKVVNYMSQQIDKKKMVIGVATYGAEYQAMSTVDGKGFTYTKLDAFNPQYGVDTAKQYNITPERNSAGELSFSYVPKEQTSLLPTNSVLAALAPRGTSSANLAAAGALAFSKKNTRQAPVTFLTWSDAGAIKNEAELAKKLGVAGVAIFKFDGGEDPGMWDALAEVADPAREPSMSRVTSVSAAPTTSTTAPIPAANTAPTTLPAATAAAFTSDLEFGMDGADVLHLQNLMTSKGYMTATPNGHFGPATQAAVTAWQKASGLPATGYFGPLSRAKIAS